MKFVKLHQYQLKTRILYGIGISEKIGDLIRQNLKGGRICLVTDKGIAQTSTPTDLRDSLAQKHFEIDIFDGAVPNPTIECVESGAEFVRREKAEILVAVGGGSVIDTAKLIGVSISNPEPLDRYFGIDRVPNPRRIPLVAVPTTAGTGSEVTRWAGATDVDAKQKMWVGDWSVAPDLAVDDPVLTMSMPSKVTAESGIDALTHALEAYVSKGASPFTDTLAIKAIELVGQNIRQAVADGSDIRVRDGMLLGSLMAGMAFPSAGCGMVHGLGMPLSGYYNASHGATVGIFLADVMEFNLMARPEKFARIAGALGENTKGLSVFEAAKKAVENVRDMVHEINIISAKEAGLQEKDIPRLAKQAYENKQDMGTNPKTMSYDDIAGFYKAVLQR